MLAPLALAEAPPGEVEYLWPENVLAWRAWCELQTQWRVGMAGATGLDYAGVAAYLTETGVAGEERQAMFAAIRAAEAAVLDVWAERRNNT